MQRHWGHSLVGALVAMWKDVGSRARITITLGVGVVGTCVWVCVCVEGGVQ